MIISDEAKRRVLAMHESGMSAPEIAREIESLSTYHVNNILRENGITPSAKRGGDHGKFRKGIPQRHRCDGRNKEGRHANQA